MASTGVNVLRWAALGAGVAYGAYHQSTLSAQAKVAQQQREYHHKQTLIEKAKEEYIKKTQPQKGDGVIRDPEDKNFDLEKYLNAVFAENK